MQPVDLIRTANRNQRIMDGTTGPVKQIIAACDVVFAIWLDEAEKDGLGLLVVKGVDLLQNIIDTDRSKACRWSAVWVASAEMAAATREVLGDDAPVVH